MKAINKWFAARVWAALLLLSIGALAQGRVTTPKEHFGFNIGDDYQLANYGQLVAYWQKLAGESPRLKLVEIGRTAEGRTIQMAIITAPENQARLDRYREISRRLALAENLSETEARALAAEGRAVVWIDGGLHATETLGAQQLIETVYQLVSRDDEETKRFLRDLIVLCTLVNPDGMDLVSNWYMREPEPTKRSLAGLPRLYQKYIGHDNNRDFYLSSQPESEAINRVFYHDWFPQIVYNHHQTGPVGTILFAPPFRDPFNYAFDPLVVSGIDLVGTAMHQRFLAEGKPGATSRSGSSYSTWWNGGLRTTVYFHNIIGLLTETIGHPTPMEVALVPAKQLPRGDLIAPIAPQKWHFRQSVDYSVTANRAVLDVASRHRDAFLFNIYRMGRNSIERGSRDHWTITPRRIAEVQSAVNRDRQREGTTRSAAGGESAPDSDASPRTVPAKYFEMLRKPEDRDPRAYIIPADQSDFLTAIKFANALIKTGVAVHRATRDFEVNGQRYPTGSLVVRTAQAFRPHVIDMFEPQDHPNDFAYPGGPPTPPYDSAGWTLAYQMGVRFDRLLEGFEGPFEKVVGLIKPPAGRVTTAPKAAGYLLSHEVNDSFIATNRLLKENSEVYWLTRGFTLGDRAYAPGTIYIPAGSGTAVRLEKLAQELGLNFEAVAERPAGAVMKLRPARIALWDRYGGSMPSGWVRWLLEQFEFPFEVVYPAQLDAGDLAAKYDVLIFVTGAIPARDGRGERAFDRLPEPSSIPEEYRGRIGSVTVARTVPQLRRFLEAGGTVLTIGTSTSLASHLGLPVANHLVERAADGNERPLPREKYYVPGSILRVKVDNTRPLAYGMPEKIDVMFDQSPVFRLRPEAAGAGINAIAWFDRDQPLRSGWAWGQRYLQDGVAVIDAPVGQGRLLLFGPEITFRAQPHGTFKFLFNGIHYSRAERR
jgi:hypothetical protein